jgi:zinc transport system substrate-binding protein
VTNNRAQPLVASHPIYDYFARRYDLNIRSVLWEPGDMPDSRQWLELETLLKNHPAKWMIWEGEPNSQSVEQLKSLGIDSVIFDPAGNVPESGDFLSIMGQNVESLQQAFQ